MIQLRGPVDVSELNLLSPHLMTVVHVGPTMTQVSICTDQAGMLGMLRHLHNLGLQVLLVQCQPGPASEQKAGSVCPDDANDRSEVSNKERMK